MEQTLQAGPKPDKDKGPKYVLDIEGTLHDWDEDTITTEQIASLGGWDPAVGVIEIDKDNNERTLQPNEVVQLKPGLGFAKKIKWKRGLVLEDRLHGELELLRTRYPDVVRNGMWFLLPSFPLPPGWSRERADVAVFLRAGYPGVGPYGIYIPQDLRFGDKAPENYQPRAEQQPPFAGNWAMLSWEAEQWFGNTELQAGHNLLTWTDGIAKRFRQGR
jgi:hypothetical protein